MNQSIKSVLFKGELKVHGVYNYNQSGKRAGHDNHIYAKKFEVGDKKIDYTSSRCLRHEIFKDLQPRQPSSKVFADQFIEMAASEVGLLRGYLAPDEGLKRRSPLYIGDAQSVGDAKIVFDQGSSSKPKESEKENKKGEAASDTSMFSKDNLPERIQKLVGGINLKELQFLSLYNEQADDFPMINKKDKNDFLKRLEKYFKDHNADSSLAVNKYKDKAAVYKIERYGVLLNQEQIRHLVKVVFQRIKMINGLKAGAKLSYKQGSLTVSFLDGAESIDAHEKDLKEKLEKIQFHIFFEEA